MIGTQICLKCCCSCSVTLHYLALVISLLSGSTRVFSDKPQQQRAETARRGQSGLGGARRRHAASCDGGERFDWVLP